MSRRMVLTFRTDGTGHGLYGELIDLRTIGPLTCRRASHIEFDHGAQQWRVLSADRGRVLFGHPSRAACVDWETTHLHPR